MFLCPPPAFVQAYGGYLATMLLSSEEFNQLKCGTAVSPITDFELYGKTFQIFFFYGCVNDYPKTSDLSFNLFQIQHLHFQNDTSAQRQIPEYIR